MHDDDSSNTLRLYELHYGGARLMVREIKNALKRRGYIPGRVHFAVFLFTQGEDRVMFYFTDIHRPAMLTALREFVGSWEDL